MKTINEYCKQISLNEYLSTKVKINVFPDDPTEDDLIKFFNGQGFKRVYPAGYGDFCDKYAKTDTPIYMMGSFKTDDGDTQWIRFGKGKNEPMFFWRIKELPAGSWGPMWEEIDDFTTEFKSFDEFKKYVCDYFEWT